MHKAGGTPMTLTSFERVVIDAFLVGEDPRLGALRVQAAVCTVTGRKHTVVGSFTDLAVPDSTPRISPPSLALGDVNVEVPGVEHGQTVLLFVRKGVLSMLEFATYTGEWPTDPQATRISYFRYVPIQNGHTLIPIDVRDPETLAGLLAGHNTTE